MPSQSATLVSDRPLERESAPPTSSAAGSTTCSVVASSAMAAVPMAALAKYACVMPSRWAGRAAAIRVEGPLRLRLVLLLVVAHVRRARGTRARCTGHHVRAG